MSVAWKEKRLKFAAPDARVLLPQRPAGARYIGLENIESGTGRLLLETEQEQVDSTVAAFDERAVLFGKLRPYLAKVAAPDFAGVASTEIMVFRPAPDTDRRFLAYSLLSDGFIKRISSMVDGAKMPRANPDDVLNMRLVLPSLNEQRRIAAWLDEKTAKVDRLLAMRRSQIEIIDEQRRSIIQEVVTRGLDPAVSVMDSGLPALGQIPAHWEMKELRYLVPQDRQIMYGIVLPGPNVDDGVPIVKGGNCEPGRLEMEFMNRTTREIEAGYVRSRLKAGDLVYSIRGSIGACAIIPPELEGANITQDAARIAPGKSTHSRFLWYSVNAKYFFSQMDSGAVGATIRGVNIKDLKRGVVALPPMHEQIAIADFLDGETSRFDRLRSAYERQIALLAEYRASIIHEAVTGQIQP